MYLARFALVGDDGTPVAHVQGAVALHAPPSGDARAAAWRQAATALAATWHVVPGASAALRVVLDERGALAQRLLATAPAASEPALRRWLAGFTRLAALVDGSVALPATRAEYDAWTTDVPPLHASPPPALWYDDVHWVAVAGPLGAALDTVLAAAAAIGARIAWQVNVRQATAGPEARRAARRNALALSYLAGMPAATVERQRALAAALDGVVAVREEIVAVATGEDARRLGPMLDRALREALGPLDVDEPLLAFRAGSADGDDTTAEALACPALATGAAAAVPDAVLRCARGLDETARAGVLAWWPGPALDPLLRPAAPDVAADDVRAPGATTPVRARGARPSPGSYVFLSYHRPDLPRLEPTLAALRRHGVPVWFDAGIDGGADWMATLEEMLAGSAAVLLALSPGAVASRWVRREALFADAIRKPVVPLRLEPVSPGEGLGLLLASTQWVAAAAPGSEEALATLLRTHLGDAPAAAAARPP